MRKSKVKYQHQNYVKTKSYYRGYKELYHGKAFKTLSLRAINLYIFMDDRTTLSEQNENFIDEKGYVFIYYTIENMTDDLRCDKRAAMNTVKELEEFGLIEKIKQGQGKPNKIYVKRIDSFM